MTHHENNKNTMRIIQIELSEQAYQRIYDALAEHDDVAEKHSVRSWIEHELNNNTDVVVEMLLSDH